MSARPGHEYRGTELTPRGSHRWLCECGDKGIARADVSTAKAAQEAHAEGHKAWKATHGGAPVYPEAQIAPAVSSASEACSSCRNSLGTFRCKHCRKLFCASCDFWLESSPELPCSECQARRIEEAKVRIDRRG